ncbi:hypothetical protein [Streptomyces tritici]|uniref:hypothetical protein n=1 Tax=Streptomyces tritici TaxID=2054410 RepID=UPI003AEF4E39
MLVLLAAAGFVSGCTGDGAGPVRTPEAAPGGSEALAERARAAAFGVRGDEDSFVERGQDTVRDGVRHASPLKEGARYEVVVACAGTGVVDVTVGSVASRVQACDGGAATYRIQSAPAAVALTVKGRAGASGAVAWRVAAEEDRWGDGPAAPR